MQVKIKKLHPDAVVPKYTRVGDCGLDLTAVSMKDESHDLVAYGTGLAIEIPEGYAGFLFPRSSVSKYDLALSNSIGLVDENYRGEIILKFRYTNEPSYRYVEGERIGQLVIMPYPKIELIEVDELSSTNRGNGAFGSSGS